ncbi:MAG: GNAT family N-acetyltransferase [Rhodospirillales bacterium]|nr:GNAT family N-acetyltransferase [Rhodospirillales bacterium]MDE2198040.1 GNAT family N-acetyltransferase [Rhodospirillales bacterium]MDE2576191.1 GNAT family N-acetyltransferase [Rhodospirillales bacterium]
MEAPPATPAPGMPAGCEIRAVRGCTLPFYRFLYDTVGAPHVWWLRRAMSDRALEAVLRSPQVAITVLYLDGQPAGFHELDSGGWPVVNLGYFGLMPHAVGRGLGPGFLRHAIDTAWRSGARTLTVNTCTADHPRALPLYQRMGFRPVREVREEWNVPTRLGLVIPDHLRI